MVLGPMVEDNLRLSLIISDGSFSIFIFRPICAVLLLVMLFILGASLFRLRPSKKIQADG
jgi:putative tricarboxylic transport membrane protein